MSEIRQDPITHTTELDALDRLEKKSSYTCNGRNVVATLAISFLIGTSSFNLAGNKDANKSFDGFELGQIPPLTTELAALVRLKIIYIICIYIYV